MRLCKCFWALRAMLYRIQFGHIGSMSYMGKPVFLSGTKNIFIGDRVRIFPGCRLETLDGGRIEICDDVSIGQGFHCTAGGNSLIIGAHSAITGEVCITNIDHEYKNLGVHILQQPRLVSETVIGENAFIGYGAMIQAGTKLGKQCIVGAHAVVRGEFPDYCVIIGAPGRIVKRYDAQTGQWEKVCEHSGEGDHGGDPRL